MAKTFDEYKAMMQARYVAERASAGLIYDDPALWSKASIKRLFVAVVAYCSYFLDSLFDLLTLDNNTAITELKPHSLRWYTNTAKAYQFGFLLLQDSDKFDNTGYTDEQIEDSKVVDYAAVVEQENEFGRLSLRMKLATQAGDDLAPLSNEQLAGVREYFTGVGGGGVKDAGVKMQIDSLPADAITMNWSIYYDPLILSSNGSRLDGLASEPVKDAIKNYLKNLPFNGVYVPTYHIDAVQAVDGVVIPEITEVQVKYGLLDFATVNTEYTPDAGYLRFYNDADLIINYIPHSEIR